MPFPVFPGLACRDDDEDDNAPPAVTPAAVTLPAGCNGSAPPVPWVLCSMSCTLVIVEAEFCCGGVPPVLLLLPATSAAGVTGGGWFVPAHTWRRRR